MRSAKIETTLVSDEEIQALNEAVAQFVEPLRDNPLLAWALVTRAFRNAFAQQIREWRAYIRTGFTDESRYDQDDFRYWARIAAARVQRKLALIQTLAPYQAFRLDRALARAKAQLREAEAASASWQPCAAAQEQDWDDCSGDQLEMEAGQARNRVKALELLRHN